MALAGPAIATPKTSTGSGWQTSNEGRFGFGMVATRRLRVGRSTSARPTAVAVHSRPPRGPHGWLGRRSADVRTPHGHAQRKQQTPLPARKMLTTYIVIVICYCTVVVRLLRLNCCCSFPVPPSFVSRYRPFPFARSSIVRIVPFVPFRGTQWSSSTKKTMFSRKGRLRAKKSGRSTPTGSR